MATMIITTHLAINGVGAKFEEILIIDESGARWLGDDLPHHRRWAKRPAAATRSL